MSVLRKLGNESARMLRLGTRLIFFFLESGVGQPGDIYKTRDSQLSAAILIFSLFARCSLHHILHAPELKGVMS